MILKKTKYINIYKFFTTYKKINLIYKYIINIFINELLLMKLM